MSNDILQPTILAIDLRPSRFGFVVLNGDRVLDWGGRMFAASKLGPTQGLEKSLYTVLKHAMPDLVLVRDRRKERDGALVRPALEVVRQTIRQQGLKLRFVRHREARSHFPKLNKDKIAEAVVSRYQALSCIRPPARRVWEPEDRRMAIFDAAATALVYLKTTLPAAA